MFRPLTFIISLGICFFFFLPAANAQNIDNPGESGPGVEKNEETTTRSTEENRKEKPLEGPVAGDAGNKKDVSPVDDIKKKSVPAKKKTARRKKRAKKKQPKKQKKADNSDDQDKTPANDSLIIFDDDYVKYSRIADISIKKSISLAPDEDIVKVPDTAISDGADSKSDSAEKGIFGLEKNTANSLARWGVLIFFFLIFLLYKIRSKRSGRKVVRTIHRR